LVLPGLHLLLGSLLYLRCPLVERLGRLWRLRFLSLRSRRQHLLAGAVCLSDLLLGTRLFRCPLVRLSCTFVEFGRLWICLPLPGCVRSPCFLICLHPGRLSPGPEGSSFLFRLAQALPRLLCLVPLPLPLSIFPGYLLGCLPTEMHKQLVGLLIGPKRLAKL